MLEYGEKHAWDNLTTDDVIEVGTDTFVATYVFISDLIKKLSGGAEEAKESTSKKAEIAKPATKTITEPPKRVEKAPTPPPAKATTERPHTQSPPPAAAVTTPVAKKVSPELEELVARAEAAIAGKPYVGDSKTEETTDSSPESTEPRIYTPPLPIGSEPPPGYIRPPPAKKAVAKPAEQSEVVKAVTLPLVAPAVSSLAESEPIISHLAGTIDNLASYLAANPAAAAKATDVLEVAKDDLTALADRFEKVREDERQSLEAKLDEQAREYSLKLLELEMEAQDKLEGQQEDFNKLFEEERSKIIQGFRQKLYNEIQTQTALINERYAIFVSSEIYYS